jgi:hypothetical protein
LEPKAPAQESSAAGIPTLIKEIVARRESPARLRLLVVDDAVFCTKEAPTRHARRLRQPYVPA